MKDVRVWVFDGILASSVAGIIDVLTTANLVLGRQGAAADRRFRWRIESVDGRAVTTASGQVVAVDGPIGARARTDAVVAAAPFVGDMADFSVTDRRLEPLLAGLRQQHARGAIVASYCTGSFLLAEAGLLDGRIATTHWAKARIFRERYPEVELRASEIITEQDRIVCSAAVTTSLNLALRLVGILDGGVVATDAARLLLVDTNRVSQASYAVADDVVHDDELVARAQRWMQRHLRDSFRLADLAGHLGVSERTLNRRFKAALGEAPLHHLQKLRIQVARKLLETRRLGIDDVSARVGYGDVSTFRQLFKRETGVSPREYERRFSTRPH
jgi:transcriptional regulator GlxA family with amidase domain